ncbi:hypothetical protein Cyast_2660 [Cyanobacterium stanieri PCC 7202]|uniref:Uncharacterized protein n=1 Tax=Cyanobacterium stanieri (strain ATCC 29140 / PCC 7202) TaxID=292563 RepID=K9YR77_CYASC|nr:hypothetical protein Cyast_2660 [Cyanobacterium stanieri PCC 7202]
MNMWLSFLFSLLLTSLVSFATPIIICVLILVSFYLMAYVPALGFLGEAGYEHTWNFLTVFGDGSGSMGMLIIGATCAIVGFLFEALNFYRYQTLIHHPLSSWFLRRNSSDFLSHKGIKGRH